MINFISMISKLLFLFLFWVIYFAIHSVLADLKVKSILIRKIPGLKKTYRLLYNIVAVVTLLPVLLYGALIPVRYIFPPSQILVFIGLAFSTWGIIVMKKSFSYYNLKSFLGVAQLKNPDVRESEGLKTNGILGQVRHPLYSGGLLIIAGFMLFSPSYANWVTSFSLILYTIIGTKLEERKLVIEFGEAYKTYQKKVPMLIPFPRTRK